MQSRETPLRRIDPAQLPAAVRLGSTLPCCPDADARALAAAIEPAPASFRELLDRLYPAHAATLAAAGQLARDAADPTPMHVDGDLLLAARDHLGVVGDLTVTGDLTVVAALVVVGRLHVGGSLVDCGPDSRVVVLGDLECGALHTSGWLSVLGDLRVHGLVLGEYNDDVLEVTGTLHAAAILSDEHSIEAATLSPRHHPAGDGSWGDQIYDLRDSIHLHELRDLLPDAAFDADGEFDPDAALRAGV